MSFYVKKILEMTKLNRRRTSRDFHRKLVPVSSNARQKLISARIVKQTLSSDKLDFVEA